MTVYHTDSFDSQWITTPVEILESCKLCSSNDPGVENHLVFTQFGNPNKPLHFETSNISIGDTELVSPIIFPICNEYLDIIQCFAIQDVNTFGISPGNKARGFSCLGKLDANKPVIITYKLETFFKIAQAGYAVVLAVFNRSCLNFSKPLNRYDLDDIEIVINQLSLAGFKELYLPSPTHLINNELRKLEERTCIKILDQQFTYFFESESVTDIIYLDQHDKLESIHRFLETTINSSASKVTLPTGHLAKPMVLSDGYIHVLEDGLFKVKNVNEKEQRYKITSPIVILGEARNDQNSDWQKYVQIKDKDGIQHNLLINYESLLGDALDAFRLLVNHGMTPPSSKVKSIFIDFLNQYPSNERFICVQRTGWKNEVYVTANRTYGKGNYVFHSDSISPYSKQGTFSEWQTLSLLIEPHKLAVFSFSCAFAGQLLTPLNEESGGFHLYGNSTDGKSTISKASCSVWGSSFSDGNNKYPLSWRTTDNALENSAELRNDSYMVLDELRQASAKTVSNVAYMLANNDGKDRMSKSTASKTKKTWNLMYLSTGEITLSEHLRRDNLSLDAGQLLRFAHISSNQGKGLGVFEDLCGFDSAQDLADHIKNLASKNYGHAGDKWLDYLVANKSYCVSKAKEIIEQFITSVAKSCSGQQQRVAKRFAIVAAAGELATEANITCWNKGRAIDSAKLCFQAWLNDLGTVDNIEELKILKHIKLFFEAHGTSRFAMLQTRKSFYGTEIRPSIREQIGFFDSDKKTYLISVAMFEKEMCIGFSSKQVKEVLRDKGWITCDEGRFTKRLSCNLPDGARPSMMQFVCSQMQIETD